MDIPETRYAQTTDGLNIAYQVLGEGPLDVIYAAGWFLNIGYAWEVPELASFLRRLASFSRLIVFDRRGTGLSDRMTPGELPTLELRMDDIRAVMDAAGSKKAAMFGSDADGGKLCALFAASFPERSLALVMYGTSAKCLWAPDYPWGWTPEAWQEWLDHLERDWGSVEFATELISQIAPSLPSHGESRRAWETIIRLSASRGGAVELERMCRDTDLRDVLPSIQVPTLVIHRTGDKIEDIEEARYLAARIPGAKLVELPGEDHAPYAGDQDAILTEVQDFLTGVRPHPKPNRILATVLFTDIVDSTKRAATLGDSAWRELIEAHDERAKSEVAGHHGTYVKGTGDGIFATFDGPARGVRCAQAIAAAVEPLGLEVRAGLHTGEVEMTGDDVRGIAVHIGARVAALAGPSQVLVSSTVKDLVAGSGLTFEDGGEHELKGVPDRWHLYRVVSGQA